MRTLTKLEAQFLNRLKEAVQNGRGEGLPYQGVYVTETKLEGPALQLGLKLDGHPALVYFNVLIYGTRPVRYHLETTTSALAQSCRPLWNRLLGPLNLVMEKSGVRKGRFHLFYEVAYPEKELKELGEK